MELERSLLLERKPPRRSRRVLLYVVAFALAALVAGGRAAAARSETVARTAPARLDASCTALSKGECQQYTSCLETVNR